MPLMPDWAVSLADHLNLRLPNSADSLGLRGGALSGPAFEETLGLFLQWRQAHQLNRTFMSFGMPQVGESSASNMPVPQWLTNNELRAQSVMEALHENLYANFGAQAVDEKKAKEAYGKLTEELGGKTVTKMCATTNYDPSLEVGLEQLGYKVHDGFSVVYPRATPRFDATDLGSWDRIRAETIPLFHLHGAVGWYRDDGGEITQHPPDQRYNPTLGAPVILPPDPKKDPLNDATVASVWREFTLALKGATHVLVLGHSLHDPALVQALTSVAESTHILVAGTEPTTEDISTAVAVRMEFGPEMGSIPWARDWLAHGNSAVDAFPPATSERASDMVIGL